MSAWRELVQDLNLRGIEWTGLMDVARIRNTPPPPSPSSLPRLCFAQIPVLNPHPHPAPTPPPLLPPPPFFKLQLTVPNVPFLPHEIIAGAPNCHGK